MTMADIGNKGVGNTAEASSGPVSSANRTPKSLKPKLKISKKSSNDGVAKTSKLKGTMQLQGVKNNKKKKIVLGSKKVSSNSEKEDAKSLNIRGMKQKNPMDGEHDEKRQESIRIKEKQVALQKKQQPNVKNKDKCSGLGDERGQMSKENHGGLQKKQQPEKKDKFSRFEKNRQSKMNKEKHGKSEKGQSYENKKGKLGGLVFMCSGETKPDCFRYRVMGVPMSKKNIVLGVKPGLKLFLYDIDLKVMYGIYKASSSSGIKLESAAFNGAFPVQVRFDVDQDCYPLPESVFKRAIKENYHGMHKFKMELTVQQVKKLVQLFSPAEMQSHAPLIHPPPMVTIQNREVGTYGEDRKYHLVSNETHRHLAYKEVPPRGREDFSQHYYPSEKEYRAYGIRRERQNFSPPKSYITPTLEPYSTAHVREHPQPMVVIQDRHITPTLEPYSRGHVREHPQPVVIIQDREVNEGTRESYALYRESLARDPRPYGEGRTYHALSNENDQHLTYKEVVRSERDDFSQNHYPSEKEYRTYGLRRERQYPSPPRNRVSPPPTLEPYSRGHVREHLLMHPDAISKDVVSTPGHYQTYSSSIPIVTTTTASTLDSYVKDPYYAYHHHGGSSLDVYQQPPRREEVPLGSYSLGRRGETYPSHVTTDHLQTRDVYSNRTDESRKGESYLTETNRSGRIENKDARMLHPVYASSALSYYDRIHKYPEASNATVSSRYTLSNR